VLVIADKGKGKQVIPVERRKAVRYRLQLPAIFRWQERSGKSFQADGVTRDVSDVGAYIFGDKCPALETVVEVQIVVPPVGGSARAWLRGVMQVIRVEDDPRGGFGFSLVGKTWAITPAEQADD
jgi:PilZ domain-containing protein